MFPKPYLFINHGWAGYSISLLPSMWSLLGYRYRSIMVWLN